MHRRSVLSSCFKFTSRHKSLEGWLELMSTSECALRAFSNTSFIAQTHSVEHIKTDSSSNDDTHAKNEIDATKLLSMLRWLEATNKQGQKVARLCIYSDNFVALQQKIDSTHHENHNNLAKSGINGLDNNSIERSNYITNSVTVNENSINIVNGNVQKEISSMRMPSLEPKTIAAECEGSSTRACTQENSQEGCRIDNEIMLYSQISKEVLINDDEWEGESWCTVAHGVLQTQLNSSNVANTIMTGKHISETHLEQAEQSYWNCSSNNNNSGHVISNVEPTGDYEEIASKDRKLEFVSEDANANVVLVQRDATVKEQVERIIHKRYANLTLIINCQKAVDSKSKITISLTVHLERKRNGNNLTIEEEEALGKFHGIAIGNAYYSCLHNALREAFKQIGIKYKTYKREENDAVNFESKANVQEVLNTESTEDVTEKENIEEWTDQVMEELEATMMELAQEQELQLQSSSNCLQLSSSSSSSPSPSPFKEEENHNEKYEEQLLDVDATNNSCNATDITNSSSSNISNNKSEGKVNTLITDKNVSFADNNGSSSNNSNKNDNTSVKEKFDEKRLVANGCTLSDSAKAVNSNNKVNGIMNNDLEKCYELDYLPAQSADRQVSKRAGAVEESLLQRYFDVILKRSAAQPSLSITTSLPSQTQITSLDSDKVDWLNRWQTLRNQIVVIELRDGDELIAKSSGPYCSFLTVLMQTLHEAAKFLTDETRITVSMRAEILLYAHINDLGDISLLSLLRKLLKQIYNIPFNKTIINYVNCEAHVWRCQISIRLPSPPDSFQYEARECGSLLILSCEEHSSKWKAINAAALTALRQLFAEIFEAQAATSSHLMKVITAVEEQDKKRENSVSMFWSHKNLEEILRELMRRDGRSFTLSMSFKRKINHNMLHTVSHIWFATLHVTDVSGRMEKRPDIIITEWADKKSKCEKKTFVFTLLLLYKEHEKEITEYILDRNILTDEELFVLKNKAIEWDKTNKLNCDSQTDISKQIKSVESDCSNLMNVGSITDNKVVSLTINDNKSDGNKTVNNSANNEANYSINMTIKEEEEKEFNKSSYDRECRTYNKNKEHIDIMTNVDNKTELLDSLSEALPITVEKRLHDRVSEGSIAVESNFASDVSAASDVCDCSNGVDAKVNKSKENNDLNEEHRTTYRDVSDMNNDYNDVSKYSTNKYLNKTIYIDNIINSNHTGSSRNIFVRDNSIEFKVALTRFLTEAKESGNTVILQEIKNCVSEYVSWRSSNDHVTWKLEERVEQISKPTSVMYKCSLWITNDDINCIPIELSFSEHKFRLFATFYAYNNLIVQLTKNTEELSNGSFDYAHSDTFRRLETKRAELLKLFSMSGNDKAVTLKVVAMCIKIIFGLKLKVHWSNSNQFRLYHVQLVGECCKESNNINDNSNNCNSINDSSCDKKCQTEEAIFHDDSINVANSATPECSSNNELNISSGNSMMSANADYKKCDNSTDDENEDDDNYDNSEQKTEKEESSLSNNEVRLAQMDDINEATFVEMINTSGKENYEIDLQKQYILDMANNCDFSTAVNLCVESVRKHLWRFFHAGVYFSETLTQGDEVINVNSKSVLSNLMYDTINEINNSETGTHKRTYTPQLRLTWARSKEEKETYLQNYTVIFEAVPSNGESAIVLERVDAPYLLSALHILCERVSSELKKNSNHLFLLPFRHSNKKETNRVHHLSELCNYNYGLTCSIDASLEDYTTWVCKVKLHINDKYVYVMADISGRKRKFTTQTATTYLLENFFSFQSCSKVGKSGSEFLANSHLIAGNLHNQIVKVNAEESNSKV